ncbi:hypothetical protein BDV98DRAFT_503387, partial [Pterulicium gracile]
IKKYLRDHCDYTFDGLKASMDIALTSVPVSLIRKWERRVLWWMDTYTEGLGGKDAQVQVDIHI